MIFRGKCLSKKNISGKKIRHSEGKLVIKKIGLKDQCTMAHNFWANLSRLIDPGAQI